MAVTHDWRERIEIFDVDLQEEFTDRAGKTMVEYRGNWKLVSNVTGKALTGGAPYPSKEPSAAAMPGIKKPREEAVVAPAAEVSGKAMAGVPPSLTPTHVVEKVEAFVPKGVPAAVLAAVKQLPVWSMIALGITFVAIGGLSIGLFAGATIAQPAIIACAVAVPIVGGIAFLYLGIKGKKI
jgi:hypothetical protein